MSQSLSALERENPPPRRKSCIACIRAKRRCDTRRPTCLRCSQRGVTCAYSTASPHAMNSGPEPTLGSPPNQFDFASLPGEVIGPVLPISSESPSNTLVTTSSDPLHEMSALLPDASGQQYGSGMDPDLVDLLAGANEANVDEVLSTAMAVMSADLAALEAIPRSPSTVLPPRTRSFSSVADALARRLQYAVDKIKAAPTQFVLTNQTPWSHPALYEDPAAPDMPRPLRAAHAACGLYMAKNPINAPVILRSVEATVDDILSMPLPPVSRREEVLARTQALLLLQIIRVFDGDIMSRAAAEQTVPVLESTAFELLPHLTFEEPLDVVLQLYPLAETRAFWAEWVWMESARRTFLITFFFMQLFRLFLCYQPLYCDGKLFLQHSWTLSAHLWGASEPVDFSVAWRERKHFVVTNANFRDVLRGATADDVDTFGKLLLTTVMGMDEVKGWLAERGGTL